MIIFRYLSRQIIGSTLAVTLALLLIVFSGRFIKYLSQVAAGKMSSDILWSTMLYRLPGFLELILPLSFFLAILLVFGRMYMDSEMTALFAGGMSRQKVLKQTLGVSLFVTIIVALISCYLTPLGLKKFNELWNNPDNFRGINTLVEGRFQKNKGTPWVSYTESLSANKNDMDLVFMASTRSRENPKNSVIIAEKGKVIEKQNGQYIELKNGYRYEGNPGSLDFQVTKFSTLGQLIYIEEPEASLIIEPDSRPTAELWASDNAKDQSILHWRLGVPLSLPIMALIALALSKTDHRRGRFLKLLPAIILYLLYVFLLNAAKDMLAKGKIPTWLGFWWLHLLFLALACVLWWWPVLSSRVKGGKGLKQQTANADEAV